MTTIACVHNTTRYLAMHYLDLLRDLQAHGKVVVIAPHDGGVAELERAGINCIPVRMSRRGLNPMVDLWYLFSLARRFRDIRPDVVFNFSIKPVIYGSLAASATGVSKVFSMVTGLGYVFGTKGPWAGFIRLVVKLLYRGALRVNRKIFFQNTDDREIFLRSRLIDSRQGTVINGTGIDTEHFYFTERPLEPFVFVLVARMLRDKGIVEFCGAASALQQRYPDTIFRLVGPLDDNPNGFSAQQLQALVSSAGVEYIGAIADVRQQLAEATVFVLPSYYREGTPRAILEAMACGLPVITTDHPGCRDPVEPGENGLLVQPRSTEDLLAAMERLRARPDELQKMGLRSRELACSRYDVHKVNREIIGTMMGAG